MTAPTLSEAALQRRILGLAHLTGWRAVHIRPARTDRGWRTAYEGDPGLPDIVLARGGRVVLAELKGNRGRLTTDQRAWLDAAGEHGRLWRPADWPAILAELGETRGCRTGTGGQPIIAQSPRVDTPAGRITILPGGVGTITGKREKQ